MMKNPIGYVFALVLLTFGFMPVDQAAAQAVRTWVSGVGDDANPCSRTAPCKTFAGAISKTAAGGEINALDSGGFGAVTITKSITLRGNGVVASVLAGGTNGIVINAATTDFVRLVGLDINGGTNSAPGLNGVRILKASGVEIVDCQIFGFTGAGNGNGVIAEPTAGTAIVHIRDSVISGNTTGIRSVGSARVTVDNTSLNFNVTGIVSNGSASVVNMSRLTLAANGTALSVLNTGRIFSYGNNLINAGGVTLPITQTLPLQ